MLNRFPASERVPAAMYKSRSCLLNLGRQDEAWTVGGALMERYPESNEAALLKAESGGE